MDKDRIVYTTCASHCGGTCRIKAYVKDERISRLETDDGPEPQFRACLKGRAYRQRVYSPDRIKYPLKRAGDRGEDNFVRISWEEAFEEVAGELLRVKETHGPSAIVSAFSGGDIVWLHNSDLIARVLIEALGGFTISWGWQSNGPAIEALMYTYGTPYATNSPSDLLNSNLIIMWGWNPADTVWETNTNLFLAQAKEAGTRIISVDPRFTNSVGIMSHQWIPIRPGTDTAMLLAMAYVMIDEDLYDHYFIDRYTVGFDQFSNYILGKEDSVPKKPGWAAEITGVPAQTIADLAREYAAAKPAALIAGISPGRTAYGEQYHRAANTLMAMTGNIGVHGGSAGSISRVSPAGSYHWQLIGKRVGFRMEGGKNVVDQGPPRKDSLPFYEKYWKGFTCSSRVNRFRLADAILKGKAGGYPADYKALFVVNCNFMNQQPNTNKIARAFHKLEFIVVQEQFMTPTAKYADIILPTCTYMERNDITVGGATPFFGRQNKVIEPLYESKSHYDIAKGLASTFGVSEFGEKSEEEWIEEVAKGCKGLDDFDEFQKTGIFKTDPPEPHVSFKEQIEDPENNPFPTPSGKIEIYSQQVADLKNPLLPPIPKYIETWESRNDPLSEKYPLQLITSHFGRRAHSQFDNIPWLTELDKQVVGINSEDAKTRGIIDGDMVRVYNDRGQVVIPAKVTEKILPGVVDIPQGAWYQPDKDQIDRGGCANTLTIDRLTASGHMPTNTCLVQVEKE